MVHMDITLYNYGILMDSDLHKMGYNSYNYGDIVLCNPLIRVGLHPPVLVLEA